MRYYFSKKQIITTSNINPYSIRKSKNPDDIPFGKLKMIAQLRGVKLEDLEK